jgi:hypothetical protein
LSAFSAAVAGSQWVHAARCTASLVWPTGGSAGAASGRVQACWVATVLGQLTGLQMLHLSGCDHLMGLQESFGQLIALQMLDLSGCIQLFNLHGSGVLWDPFDSAGNCAQRVCPAHGTATSVFLQPDCTADTQLGGLYSTQGVARLPCRSPVLEHAGYQRLHIAGVSADFHEQLRSTGDQL